MLKAKIFQKSVYRIGNFQLKSCALKLENRLFLLSVLSLQINNNANLSILMLNNRPILMKLDMTTLQIDISNFSALVISMFFLSLSAIRGDNFVITLISQLLKLFE